MLGYFRQLNADTSYAFQARYPAPARDAAPAPAPAPDARDAAPWVDDEVSEDPESGLGLLAGFGGPSDILTGRESEIFLG